MLIIRCFAFICSDNNLGIDADMTNTAAIELKKFDGTRYMAPDGSAYSKEQGHYANDHGLFNKHVVGDSVGDSMAVSKDLNDVKVKAFKYNFFLHI